MSRLNVAWSFSALDAFETCPLRYYLTRVSKAVVEPPSDALVWGRKIHGALEARAKRNTPLPPEMQHYEPYVAKILAFKGKKIVEEKFAIDKAFRPSGWFDKTAWCRCVVDIGVIGTKQVLLFDWKTGNWKPDTDQLKLSAAISFAQYPWVDEVTTGFIWLKDKRFDKETFQRANVMDIWGEFLPRVQRLEAAYAENKWQPKPSGLCRNWCPVGQKNCAHCGR